MNTKRSKPPLGSAKHIYKMIGSLYKKNGTISSANQLLPTSDERKSIEEARYATKVISDHERSFRSTSAVSKRARNTCDSLHRTIRSSMEVKKTYDDTILSLENTC